MKLLRKTIRNLVMENASIADSSVIKTMKKHDLIIVVDMVPSAEGTVYLCFREHYDVEYHDIERWIGNVSIKAIDLENTMEVTLSKLRGPFQRQGIGKLLYNVALATCTKDGIWLMADRNEVSADARRIYDAWKKSAGEYEIEQMDEKQPDESHYATLGDDYNPDVDFFLTKDRSDDVSHESFRQAEAYWNGYDDSDPRAQWGDMIKDWWYFFDDDYKEDFLDSGLTKRFKMKDADGFIQVLEANNLLYRIN